MEKVNNYLLRCPKILLAKYLPFNQYYIKEKAFKRSVKLTRYIAFCMSYNYESVSSGGVTKSSER